MRLRLGEGGWRDDFPEAAAREDARMAGVVRSLLHGSDETVDIMKQVKAEDDANYQRKLDALNNLWSKPETPSTQELPSEPTELQ